MVRSSRLYRGLRVGRSTPSIGLCALAAVIGIAVAPKLATGAGLAAIASNGAALALVAVGVAVVLAGGGIDLSVGAIVEMAAGVGLVATHHVGGGVTTEVVVTLGIAVGAGAVNGFLVAWLGLPALLATLATSYVFLSVGLELTGGLPVAGMAPDLRALGVAVGPIPVSLIVVAAVGVVAAIIFKYSSIGRRVLFIGANRTAAALDGENVRMVEFGTYVISGLLCGIAALVLTAQLTSFFPSETGDIVLLALVVAVFGGTNLFGGQVGVAGAVAGAGVLAILEVTLALHYVDPYIVTIVQGLVLVGAVSLATREPAT